jgi:hypothetical protein
MATITGHDGAVESLVGTPQDDTFYPFTGFKSIDGGAGIDTVVIAEQRADFSITPQGQYIYIDTVSGASGLTSQLRLINVERVAFSDISVALDMGAGQSGGEAALTLGAAVGVVGLANKPLVGAVLQYFDQGHSVGDVASLLVGGGTMAALAGGADNASFVNFVYRNLTGNLPDAPTLAMFKGLLDTHSVSQDQLLAAAIASQINQQHVNLVGLAQTGMLFL